MEQMQQHEWVDTGSYKFLDTEYKVCDHCGVEKKSTKSNGVLTVEYRDKYNHLLQKEPVCVIRKIIKDEKTILE